MENNTIIVDVKYQKNESGCTTIPNTVEAASPSACIKTGRLMLYSSRVIWYALRSLVCVSVGRTMIYPFINICRKRC